MAATLDKCFTIKAYINEENTLNLGRVRAGASRMVGHVSRGHIQGEGLLADLLPNTGDWLQVWSPRSHSCALAVLFGQGSSRHGATQMNPETGASFVDVRAQFRIKEGHGLFLRYEGVAQLDDKTSKVYAKASDAGSRQCGDHEWFITPVFETNHPDWKWIETAVFVAEGTWVLEGAGELWAE